MALLLRGLMLVTVSHHPERLHHRDTGSYLQPARNLLAGHGFSQQEAPPFTPDLRRTPAYPLFIALIYGVFGPHPLFVAGGQVLISGVTAGLAYLLGTQLLPEREARLGGLLLVLSLGAIVYSVYLLTETLFTLLLLGGSYAVAVHRAKGQKRWLVGGGLLAGTAMLCRPIALFYPPLVALLILFGHRDRWREGMSAALLFLGVTSVVVAPWLFRNYQVIGSPTLSTISSRNVLLYNAVSLEADLRDAGQAQVRAEMVERVQQELARRGGVDNEVLQVRLYNEWSRRIILAHPWRYVLVHLKNDLNSLLPNVTEFLELLGGTQGGKGTLSVLNQYGLWAAVRHYFGGKVWLLWLALPLMGLLGLTYLGMLAGLLILARRRAWFSLALLLLPIAYFLLIPGAPSNPRFRVPVMPDVCLLAGMGLVTLWHRVRRRPRRSSGTQSRIRVLHVITRLIVGGAQENTMLTAALLDPDGYAVDVVSGPQTGSEGSLAPEVRARGIRLTILPSLVREVNPLKDAVALVVLTCRIRRGRYDVVHTHSSKAGILGRWAAHLAGTPVIVHTVHGWGHHDRQPPLVQRWYILLEQITQRITDRLIVVSPRNIQKGLADGIATPDKYVTIRSGVDLDRFQRPSRPREDVRAELGIPLECAVVGTVTRLSPQKAPLDFVAATAQVAAHRQDVHFVIVGDGPLRADVEARVVASGLAERVHLTGLRRDVADLMHSFDIFALTSLWEGLPRVLPQAMAAGLPIVATAVDGNAEAVEDGLNGFLTSPGDPYDMAAALLRLLERPALSRRMGQAGRARALEFDVHKMVSDIAALYETLLRERSPVIKR
jgi:glycosyltransferase involved in cell wall biosynthesis/4-amino-4-deoxy-L-arabinose transferase-like glycosyltransferase